MDVLTQYLFWPLKEGQEYALCLLECNGKVSVGIPDSDEVSSPWHGYFLETTDGDVVVQFSIAADANPEFAHEHRYVRLGGGNFIGQSSSDGTWDMERLIGMTKTGVATWDGSSWIKHE